MLTKLKTTRKKQVAFMMEPKLYQEIARLADRKGMTFSGLTRALLLAWKRREIELNIDLSNS